MLPPNNLGPDELGVSVNETLYQVNPKESHLVAVKRISKYLKGTPNLGLCMSLSLDAVLKSSGSRVSWLSMMFSMTRETLLTTQVADGQPAKVPVTTADNTQSLDGSESAKEQETYPNTADARKVQEKNVEKEVKSFGLTSIGDVTFEQLMDEYNKKQSADVERSDHILGEVHDDMDQLVEEPADSDLYLVSDDEVMLVYGFEANESIDEESDKVDIKDDEATNDNLLDEMTDLNVSSAKPSDPLGPFQAELSSLSIKVTNLESSIAKKVTKKLEELVLRMATLKPSMLELIHNPLNKELNALNTLETHRFKNLQKKLLTAIRAKVGKLVQKTLWKEIDIVQDRLSYYGGKLDQADVNLHELINLMKDMEDMALELAEEAKVKAAKEAKIAKEAKANNQGEPQPINTTSSEEAKAEA
ncbi:hypothetical protein Tco_0458305 [Tanacetum coccineum]